MTNIPAEAKNKGSIATSFISLLKSIISTVRSALFVFYYPIFVSSLYNEKAIPFRTEVFGDIDTVIPSDKESDKIRILEIGVGPGFNLDFFPKQCRLIALDTNAYFKDVLIKKLRKHPGIILEKFINESAENMSSVLTNSIDVVVSTHIHCSVDSNQKVLKEINRVLVPGGRYYFLEHVLDAPNTTLYKCQLFLNKIGLWRFIFNGCNFANFEEKISKVDFFEYEAKRYNFLNQMWYDPSYFVSSNYGGCARKK